MCVLCILYVFDGRVVMWSCGRVVVRVLCLFICVSCLSSLSVLNVLSCLCSLCFLCVVVFSVFFVLLVSVFYNSGSNLLVWGALGLHLGAPLGNFVGPSGSLDVNFEGYRAKV